MASNATSASGDATRSVDRIVVIGAGDCGAQAALRLRELGWQGELTLVGDDAQTPYQRPELSKQVLVDDTVQPRSIANRQRLAELGIAWTSGIGAVAIDPGARLVTLADGGRIGYDRLLIATGARARRPACAGPDVVTALRTADDAYQLRSRLRPGTRLLVIGGGFVGLEVAASAVARGCSVAVIEFAHRLMSRVVPAPVAEVIHDRHLREGVDLRCGVGVERLERRGEAVRAALTDGTTLVADVVVGGVGAVPNTELAAGAGLAIMNGIAVDAHLRSSDPAIFAGGDCCSVPHPLYGGERVRVEAWRVALTHADIAAHNLLGGDVEYTQVPWFWSDQYDLGLQIAGLHAAAASDVARARDDGTEIRFGLDADGRIVSASGVARGAAIGRDIRIAEMLIERRAVPVTSALSNPGISLRDLLG